MNINCTEVAERYLLNQNPLYAFSFPLSILIAIIVFGCAKAFKWTDNSYINQILIPILTLLLCMVIFDITSRQMISKHEKNKIIIDCKAWYNNSRANINKLSQNESIEDFTNNLDNINNINNINEINEINDLNNIDDKEIPEQIYDVIVPISEIPNISPFPIESIPTGNKCIQNSNCCSLCSVSNNSNPCNIIAPIPGPQWIPQSAKSVQDRLVNNNYTKAVCNFN